MFQYNYLNIPTITLLTLTELPNLVVSSHPLLRVAFTTQEFEQFINELLDLGASIQVYDPQSMQVAKKYLSIAEKCYKENVYDVA